MELQPPGHGPLSTAVLLHDGRAELVDAADIPAAHAGRPALAFQSYPALLVASGRVPPQLAAAGRGVDVAHRDARLALGLLPDGRLLVVLSRFAAVGEMLARVPMGPTVPELAAIMGALGCVRAVALDGGLSGQLLVRDGAGTEHRWSGLRRVPLGLLARPR